MFRKASIKRVFDILHGISNDIDVHEAVEMIRRVFKLTFNCHLVSTILKTA